MSSPIAKDRVQLQIETFSCYLNFHWQGAFCISILYTYINLLGPSDAIWLATEIWVNIGSGNGLLPDGTKPLPETMLTYHQ